MKKVLVKLVDEIDKKQLKLVLQLYPNLTKHMKKKRIWK